MAISERSPVGARIRHGACVAGGGGGDRRLEMRCCSRETKHGKENMSHQMWHPISWISSAQPSRGVSKMRLERWLEVRSRGKTRIRYPSSAALNDSSAKERRMQRATSSGGAAMLRRRRSARPITCHCTAGSVLRHFFFYRLSAGTSSGPFFVRIPSVPFCPTSRARHRNNAPHPP